jgi:aspartate carbamoyltransferase catalytic subunit
MNHILTGKQFANKTLLDKLFAKALELEQADSNGGMPKLLAGKVVATLFYEPSTRTRLSFESSALKLGAGVITVENAKATSSDVKGESLEDTIRMVNCYSDVVILRHPEALTAERASKVSSTPVINAGDGGNEHPTQAIYDLWTIKKELGRLDNLKVVFGFDPKHSRTIRSLARLLAIFPNNHFTFISPSSLKPAQELIDDIKKFQVVVELKNTLDNIGTADVLYINRLQAERFENLSEFETHRKQFVLKPEHLTGSKAIVLNPLPRIDEIDLAVDLLPNAKYFIQAKNGLYIRSAVLLYALNLL